MSETNQTQTVVVKFLEDFNRHDADALAAVLSDDTVFEDTSAPDGKRFEGKSAVVEYWRAWFARNPDAQFEGEEMVVSGDTATVRWIYRKTVNGKPWHRRGVDIFKVRNGKMTAKLAYVKA